MPVILPQQRYNSPVPQPPLSPAEKKGIMSVTPDISIHPAESVTQRYLKEKHIMSTVTFIGAGSFGTALSTIVAAKGCRVNIFDIDKAHLDRMESAMENVDYLPGVKLSGDFHFYTDNEAALKDADVIVFSLPAQHFRSALAAALPFIKKDALAMNIAKGIEQKTLKRMSEVAEEVGFDMTRYACISGPSHAEEVGIGVPTAVSVSSRDPRTARSISDLFSTNRFRIYTNTDMLGMEIAGSVKNVMAVGSGIIDGMGFGDNTRAAMMTRGIAEMTRLGMALGAKFETFDCDGGTFFGERLFKFRKR